MKKTKRKPIAIFISVGIVITILFTVVVLGRCGNNNGFERGFEFGRWCGPVHVAIRSESDIFHTDNFELELFFGWESDVDNIHFEYRDRISFSGVALFFSTSWREYQGSQFDDYRNIEGLSFIRKIASEDAISGKFNVLRDRRFRIGLCGNADRKVFSHSEKIVVPSSYFAPASGHLVFYALRIMRDIEEEIYFSDHVASTRLTTKHIGVNQIQLG